MKSVAENNEMTYTEKTGQSNTGRAQRIDRDTDPRERHGLKKEARFCWLMRAKE